MANSISTARAEELAEEQNSLAAIYGDAACREASDALRSLARERDEKDAERRRLSDQLIDIARVCSDIGASAGASSSLEAAKAVVAAYFSLEAALAAERQRAEKLADALTALLEVPEVRGEIYWPSDRAVRDAARAALADEREEGK